MGRSHSPVLGTRTVIVDAGAGTGLLHVEGTSGDPPGAQPGGPGGHSVR
ncbi:MAG: hypothetical protein QOK02_4764 [Mycobacterium sp.]|nr:hypothetical protein [Mycobacterium sp.]